MSEMFQSSGNSRQAPPVTSPFRNVPVHWATRSASNLTFLHDVPVQWEHGDTALVAIAPSLDVPVQWEDETVSYLVKTFLHVPVQ